jgi:uncharacterized protein (TIGR02246 family)
MKLFTRLALIGSLLLLAGCQAPAPQEQATADLTADDHAAIEATLQTFVDGVLAGDAVMIAGTYTEDALLMPPNHPNVTGREAIEAYFASWPPVSELDCQITEVNGSGDTAYIVGKYTMTIPMEEGDPIQDAGKFFEVRKKQADGSWLFHRDMFNSDMPAAN